MEQHHQTEQVNMGKSFDDLADAYEAMIDWPKRLANETPFFRWVFERAGARRVLDAACGTGHHAQLFASWGLEVEGADISPAMVEKCRSRWGENHRLRWAVRGFGQRVPEAGSFDVTVCIGNSLALAGDMGGVQWAVGELLAAVRPGGFVVLHVLNIWRLPEGVVQWQKCVRAELAGGPRLIIKGVHRAGGRGFVDMLVTDIAAEPPALASECVPFLGLTVEDIGRSAGDAVVEVFGGYGRTPYAQETSVDLIAVLRRC